MDKKRSRKKFWFFFAIFVILFPIIYPLWHLLVFVINKIGGQCIRNVKGKLQTPIVTYQHPQTKRHITFIAVIHIGTAEYFRLIQSIINSLKGYTVLFESVGKLTDEERESLTENERQILESIEDGFVFRNILCQTLSLTGQKEALEYNDNWIRTDANMIDVIRAMDQEKCSLFQKLPDMKKLEDNGLRVFLKWSINCIFLRFAAFIFIINLTQIFSRKGSIFKKIILNSRNEIAVEGIRKYSTDSNIVTIWGAAHLPGIEKELKDDGFVEIDRVWLTAYEDNGYSFLKFCCDIAEIGKSKRQEVAIKA